MNSHAIINRAEKDKIIDGAELRVHINPESPGHIVKSARERAGISIEEPAEKRVSPNAICTGSRTKGKGQVIMFSIG